MKNTVIRVTKEFTFDMAHALLGYDGPCSNIHGHTYNLLVTLRGNVLNESTHPKDGMLIDFGNLKMVVHEKVIKKYDHALVLNKELAVAHQLNINQISKKVIFTNFQPTCENLLIEFKNILFKTFQMYNYELCALKLYETPTSYAEWYSSDN